MMPRQGLTSGWFGRRTRSLGSGGRLIGFLPAIFSLLLCEKSLTGAIIKWSFQWKKV